MEHRLTTGGRWLIVLVTFVSSHPPGRPQQQQRPRRDVLRTADLLISAVHPDDRAHVGSCLVAWQSCPGPLRMEVRVQAPGDTIRWIVFLGQVMTDDTGVPSRALGITIDDTVRHIAEAATREELLACLEHLLAGAGNASLMTRELRQTLVDHAAGNYRILVSMAAELLMSAAQREITTLDEKLYLQVYGKPETHTSRRAAAAR